MDGRGKGVRLWNEAKKIIPGGSQLLSKRAEMFLPDQWPAYYRKAKGVEIWDLDGRKYIDMSTVGIGTCTLGYADPDVNRVVKKVIDNGSMATLNAPEEVELAKLLMRLHPWAEMVRYARTGGESMAIAARIARAYSGKDKIAFCGYHGWADWYLAANLSNKKNLDGQLLPGLMPRGVPRGLAGTVLPFHYNKLKELEVIAEKHKDVGTIVVEPSRHYPADKRFWRGVRRIANQIGAVLVVDEITVGWKIALGGYHLKLGITPDIAVFAKGMANGYPMAAIIGKKEIMEAAQTTFISSTFWTERIGPAAAIACIKKMKRLNVQRHLMKIGSLVSFGWRKLAKKHGLKIEISGPPALVEFVFQYGEETMAVRTLFTQEMLDRGFLDTGLLYVTYAHKPSHVRKYLRAVDEAFAVVAKAIRDKKVHALLRGPVAHNRFKRIS